jgi:hypothetical protein
MDALVATLKTLEAADLFKVMKQALAEAEKRTKGSVPKGKAATTAKKAGSMPKGVVPPQLKKPRAWVDFTHAHALENGWESFTVYQSKKNKVTGEKEDEEIEMPASVLHDGAHVYDGSVTEKNPTGKQLIHKYAMSLSKQRWAPKDKSGTHEELYAEFLESYVEDVVEVSDSASVASSKKVTKVTAAEKAAAAELKKAEKEAEKEAKKAEKEAEKEAKKAEKARAKKMKEMENVAVAAMLQNAVRGGANIPHSAELLEQVMTYFGGVSGFSALLVKQYFDSKPGSSQRGRAMEMVVRLVSKNVDQGGAQKPLTLWSEDELESELNDRFRRVVLEGRMTDGEEASAT